MIYASFLLEFYLRKENAYAKQNIKRNNIWFSKNTNDKLLSETIDDTNIERKQAEILSRFYSSIQEYDPNTLPNKDEINSGFIKILKR